MEYTCSLGARSWDIYYKREGAERVAFILSETLTKSVRKARAYELNDTDAWDYVHAEVAVVMDCFRRYGAFDTEPRTILAAELDNIFPHAV